MPMRRTAAALPLYFDPALAPDPMRSLLAGWVGAEAGALAARMSPEAWGRLIRESVELHRWRGSKHGIRRALELATGHTPLITDYSDASCSATTRGWARTPASRTARRSSSP